MMRGYGHGNESPANRRGGSDDTSETLSIDSSLVGLIIGRQGENMRRIESETGARVQFLSSNEPGATTRQCKISGTTAAKADAKAEIYRIIQENSTSKGHGQPSDSHRAGGSAPQAHLREGENASQIMVPDRTVGLIIGRGGETIRDLQERSGCHVNIVGEQKSVNGLRPVNLIGTPQAAQRAKDLIMEIVDSDTKSLANPSQGGGGRGQSYGFDDRRGGDGEKINDTLTVPSAAVGMIIGKGMNSFALL
jgi:far upstream element-binding protein